MTGNDCDRGGAGRAFGAGAALQLAEEAAERPSAHRNVMHPDSEPATERAGARDNTHSIVEETSSREAGDA